MIFTFNPQKEDFVKAMLFSNDMNPQAKKQRNRSWIYTSLFFYILAFFAWLGHENITTFYLLMAVATTAFYPYLSKQQRLKSAANWINQSYQNWTEDECKISFSEEYFEMSGQHSWSKVALSQIEALYETADYYMIRITPGHVVVIPKSTLNDETAFKNVLISVSQNIGIGIISKPDWI